MLCVYAPTLQAEEGINDSFYWLLEEEIRTGRARESLPVLGDFNARVGDSCENWPNCIGREGVGKMNTNGQRVLELCAALQLCVTNTYFAGPISHNTTWQHPRSHHWQQLDLVLSRRNLLKEIFHTRAIRSAEGGSDHSLVLCKIRTSLKKVHKMQKAGTKWIDRASMRNPIKVSNFPADVNSKRADSWKQLSPTLYKQALKHFGSQSRKNKIGFLTISFRLWRKNVQPG